MQGGAIQLFVMFVQVDHTLLLLLGLVACYALLEPFQVVQIHQHVLHVQVDHTPLLLG